MTDMAATELFLHIGLNKTGTSAIQRFLAENREHLLSEGILYPIAGMVGNAHYGLSNALGFRMDGFEPAPELLHKYEAELRCEVEMSNPHKIIVSSEFFILPGAIERVREFFSSFHVRVVVYLRRHDSWWISAYNQSIRAVSMPGWLPGFKNYLAYQRRNPNRWYLQNKNFVDTWAAVFGHDNIIVRPYERGQNHPGLLHDFLTAVGCQGGNYKGINADFVNHSVPLKSLQIIDAYQRGIVDDRLRNCMIDWVIANVDDGLKFDLPLAMKHQLVEENVADYAYIARKYLGRDDGLLFHEPITSSTDEDLEEIYRLTADQIVEITMKALEETRNLRASRDHLLVEPCSTSI